MSRRFFSRVITLCSAQHEPDSSPAVFKVGGVENCRDDDTQKKMQIKRINMIELDYLLIFAIKYDVIILYDVIIFLIIIVKNNLE